MADSDLGMLARLIRDLNTKTSELAVSPDIVTYLEVDPIRVRFKNLGLKIKKVTAGTVLVERGHAWRTTSEWGQGVFDEGVTAEGDVLTMVEG